MEKKKIVPTWVTIIMLVLCAGGMVFDIISISQSLDYPLTVANFAVHILALLSAVLYCTNGFKKDSAIYYKTSWFLTAAVTLLFIINEFIYGDKDTTWSLIIIFTGALFLGRLIFAFAQNLGKQASYVLLCFIYVMFFFTMGLLVSKDPTYLIIALVNTALNGILGLMVFAKYKDKDARGTI